MTSVLESIPLDQETKSLLLGAPSKLRPLYDLMLARESGDWNTTSECSRKLGLSESEVAEAFWQAMQWAKQISAG